MKKLLICLLVLCFSSTVTLKAQDKTATASPKLEVYYFHGTMRCPTCLAVEDQTRKTLDENFKTEMDNGIIKLAVLNFEEKENKDLVEKFQIGWSSLLLIDVKSGTKTDLTQDAFAKARTEPDAFRSELTEKIKELTKN